MKREHNAATACKSYTQNSGVHASQGHKRARSSAQMQQTNEEHLENNDWGTFARDYAQRPQVKSKLERRNWAAKEEFNKWKTMTDELENHNAIV